MTILELIDKSLFIDEKIIFRKEYNLKWKSLMDFKKKHEMEILHEKTLGKKKSYVTQTKKLLCYHYLPSGILKEFDINSVKIIEDSSGKIFLISC